MTQSNFFTQNDTIIGFELKGHSGKGNSGKDIVCAAISSAADMTVNTIEEVYRLPDSVDNSDGYLKILLTLDDAKRCRELLEGFRLHLTELQKQYPKFLHVNITEV